MVIGGRSSSSAKRSSRTTRNAVTEPSSASLQPLQQWGVAVTFFDLQMKHCGATDREYMTKRHGRTARQRQCNRTAETTFDHGKGCQFYYSLRKLKRECLNLIIPLLDMADEIIVIHDASFEEFRKWLGERGFPKSKITLAEFEG